jgi:cytochrome c553
MGKRSVGRGSFATVLGLLLAAIGAAGLGEPAAPAPKLPTVYLYQGPDWDSATRNEFYSQDQGSRIMPLAWAQALQTADGKPFLSDSLGRYGYLPNSASNLGLPVGFTASGPAGSESLGMTCAACHTREIDAGGTTYRIDGGPAIADFQAMLTDLDAAVQQVRSSPAVFTAFATKVLGQNPSQGQLTALRQAVDLWYLRQHTLFSHAIPNFGGPPGPAGWGVGRLDAVSMIFDRLTGLDIGPAPSGLIASNIQPADAPVRYPFIWNAPRQDFTQWPGFATNGNDILGLVRNLGEVYGVFAEFSPKKDNTSLFNADFMSGNSANFDGLSRLEALVRKIGPPKWPWAIDPAAAARGEAVFNRRTADGGCVSCHGITKGQFRSLTEETWATPMVDSGTDTREYDVLVRNAQTGVLSGAGLPLDRLSATDKQFNILAASVIGSITQKYSPFGQLGAMAPMGAISGIPVPSAPDTARANAQRNLAAILPASQQSLVDAFQSDVINQNVSAGAHPYESRVLQGIWAAAPYLHNGSVESLTELLTPSQKRKNSFALGRAYDLAAVGLAAMQPGSTAVRNTTGCEDRHSGNSHCGHDYGTTTLNDAEKRDLIEYLKTL